MTAPTSGATPRPCRECGGNLRHADECWTGQAEAALTEALALLERARLLRPQRHCACATCHDADGWQAFLAAHPNSGQGEER